MKTGKSSCGPSRLKITKCCHKSQPQAKFMLAWGLSISFGDGSSHPYSRREKIFDRTGESSANSGGEIGTQNILPHIS